MVFDIFKINFLLKKLNYYSSCIIIVILFIFVILLYFFNSENLYYAFNIESTNLKQVVAKTFSINFDIHGKDTLVFLHIQKTGGTLLERSLTKDGLINFKCQCVKREKRCNCLNKLRLSWIFSRFV